MRIEGSVVAITGGARGIGLATAKRLLADGAKVAIGDVDEHALKVAADELGITCFAPLDVTSTESFTAFLDLVESDLGPLDVLVNNAGIMPVGPLHEESDEITRRLVAVNVVGVITGSKLAAQRMLPRGRGHIINVSSLVGENPLPGAATYSATKHAVNALTEAARMEYHGTGVDFSTVMPTFTNTELIAGAGQPRGFRNAEPHQIAAAIADLIRHPKARVRVTLAAGALSVLHSFVPRALTEPLMRAAGGDALFLGDVDHAKRKEYDERLRDT